MSLRLRRSPQTLAILSILLRRTSSWQYGYELLRETGLKSGTLYPVLARLQRAGWLEQKWNKPSAPGRPPRHLYRLSRQGESAARKVVQQAPFSSASS